MSLSELKFNVDAGHSSVVASKKSLESNRKTSFENFQNIKKIKNNLQAQTLSNFDQDSVGMKSVATQEAQSVPQ